MASLPKEAGKVLRSDIRKSRRLQGSCNKDKPFRKNSKHNPSPPRSIRLLVVEDNFLVRTSLELMLEKLGYLVDFACDGLSALALYSQKYDLILMDIELPDVDGITVTQVIRKIEKNHHVPIVAMTSHFAEPDYQEKFLLAGMNGFSNKPDMTQLQALINEHVPA